MAHIENELLNHAPPRTAPRKIKPAALALFALTAGFLATTAVPASAEQAANIKEMSFTTQQVYNQEITVISTDNKKWDKIASGSYIFGAHINIDTKHPGWVRHVGIVLGACGGAGCSGKPLLWYRSPVQRDYENQMAVTFPTSKIPVSTTGIATVPFGDQIVAQCNSHLTPGGANAHTFAMDMPVTFVADTLKNAFSENNPYSVNPSTPAQWTDQTDHAKTAHVLVKVKCEPFKLKRDVDGVAAKEPATLSVGAIELFRTTYANATSQPNPGTVCKKAKWLVRLSTNKAGPVKFKLWTKIGDAPMTSKVVDAWSAFDGPGKYKAEYAEWTEVTKTGVVKAMAEDKTNPIGQSSGWKEITLHCTGAGGGGLAGTPGNANPDNGAMPNTLKVTGELTLADKAGAPKDKPRLGQAVFKIWASKPGNTSYKLTCSGGRNWQGTLPTFKIADHKYQAVGAHNFQIDKTEQIGCALRSTSLPKNDVIAVASKLFELVKRNPHLGGPGNVVNLPTPQPGKPNHPARPGIKIAPTPKISCAGGKVSNNTCFCPAGTTKIHAGLNAYRCMTRTARPQRLAPQPAREPAPRATHRLRHRLQSVTTGSR